MGTAAVGRFNDFEPIHTSVIVVISNNGEVLITLTDCRLPSRGVSPRLDHCLDWTSYWIYLFTYYRQFTPASLSCAGDVCLPL